VLGAKMQCGVDQINPIRSAEMAIPHYISEDKSDMRGIKSGWYTMEEDGKLSSGPFVSRQQCLNKDAQYANGLTTSRSTPAPLN
jgi:hypothetical protein